MTTKDLDEAVKFLRVNASYERGLDNAQNKARALYFDQTATLMTGLRERIKRLEADRDELRDVLKARLCTCHLGGSCEACAIIVKVFGASAI